MKKTLLLSLITLCAFCIISCNDKDDDDIINETENPETYTTKTTIQGSTIIINPTVLCLGINNSGIQKDGFQISFKPKFSIDYDALFEPLLYDTIVNGDTTKILATLYDTTISIQKTLYLTMDISTSENTETLLLKESAPIELITTFPYQLTDSIRNIISDTAFTYKLKYSYDNVEKSIDIPVHFSLENHSAILEIGNDGWDFSWGEASITREPSITYIIKNNLSTNERI